MSAIAGTSGQVQEPGIQSGLSCGRQGLSHHLLPSQVCISRKLQLKVEPRLKPGHSDLGCRLPEWHLNLCTKCLSLDLSLVPCIVLILFGLALLISVEIAIVNVQEINCPIDIIFDCLAH